MTIKSILAAGGLTVLAVTTSALALGATKHQIDARVNSTLARFESINTTNQTLTNKAAGVLIFPRVTKGGIGVGAEFGEGALQVNGKTVGYYSVGAGSVGLTLGLAEHSEIIMFMTQNSLDKFTNADGWSIGADAGITVISGGADGTLNTETDQKPILAFLFANKGLIGDLSLEGTKITKIKTGA
jgi:lipid-binding SYLF domain-containing protein